MARKGVSYEEFLGAVSQLLQENRVVTQRTVRDKLGTGSMSTIGVYLSKWRQSEKPESAERPVLTDRIIQALQDEITIAVMESKAEDAYQHTAVYEENAQLVTELKNVEEDLAAESAENMKLREELAELRGQMEQLTKTNAELTQSVKDSAQELKEKYDTNVTLSEDLAELRGEWGLQRADLVSKCENQQKELDQLHEKLTEYQKENVTLEKSLTAVQEVASLLQSDNKNLQWELSKYREKAEQQPDIQPLTSMLESVLERVGSLEHRLSQPDVFGTEIKPVTPEVVINAETVTEVTESQTDLVAAKTVKKAGVRKPRSKKSKDV